MTDDPIRHLSAYRPPADTLSDRARDGRRTALARRSTTRPHAIAPGSALGPQILDLTPRLATARRDPDRPGD